MMRTIEVLLVIIIITGAFVAASYFAVLPTPRQVSPVNLSRLSLTTLQMLDSEYDLSKTAFEADNPVALGQLQVALSASLPPNIIYNLTIYDVNQGSGQLYKSVANISNAQNLGVTSDVSTYTVASSNVTFNVTPQKIGENGGGGTLYILNCSDANGWWITGYTAQSLAQDLYNLLSPYFVNTIMVQNTAQLRQLLDNQTISGSSTERVQNAVIINTFGESIPMPVEYAKGQSRESLGYNVSGGTHAYTKYCYTLGSLTRLYNWTWASIVGYPFYYVSNTQVFANQDNTFGLFGMNQTYQGGIRAFLEGLDNQTYLYNEASSIQSASSYSVTLNSTVIDYCNYYGIYPSPYQTSTRALSTSLLASYHLSVGLNIFNQVDTYLPGAFYNHNSVGSNSTSGSLLAIGLTRTPDIRVTAVSLLSYYHPRLYPSQFSTEGTSRLVVLQLGLAGGS